MGLIKQIKRGVKHPNLVARKLLQKYSSLISNDRRYLSLIFFLSHGKKMNWENPRTFNEKTTWLKLWSKDRGFERYVDKIAVREYVREKIGDEYLIPAYGHWDTFEEIEFDRLPEKYVLKTTHDSGGVVIVNGSLPSNAADVINRHLRHNYFLKGREYPYKNVRPRIIAEKLMVDESGWDLKDYKFFCFNGKPRVLFLASERFRTKDGKAKFDYFDINLTRLPITSFGHEAVYEPGEKHPDIPGYQKMLELAEILSEGFPFIRIDFYNVNGKIYFGEMTFFHDDGVVPINPPEWDIKLGDMISLPES